MRSLNQINILGISEELPVAIQTRGQGSFSFVFSNHQLAINE